MIQDVYPATDTSNTKMFAVLLAVSFAVGSVAYIIEMENVQDVFSLPTGYFQSSVNNHSSAVMCTFFVRSRLRDGLTNYNLADITVQKTLPGKLCTHFLYHELSFSTPTNKIVVNDDYHFIKKSNSVVIKMFPRLRTIVEISLPAEGISRRHEKETRQNMIFSLIETIRDLEVNGVYFDAGFNFHFPENNIILFLKELKRAFSKEGFLIISNIRGQSTKNIDKYYNYIKYSSHIFDYILVIGRFFESLNSEIVSHNSPLHVDRSNGTGSIEMTLTHLIFNKWVPPEKIILIIYFDGITSVLKSENSVNGGLYGINAQSTTGVFTSPLKDDAWVSWMWHYYEICYSVLQKNETWKFYWDDLAKQPYMNQGVKWISFNNPKSIYEKVAFAKKLGIFGFGVEHVDTDDFKNICSAGIYPLLNTINYALTKVEKETGSLLCTAHAKYKEEYKSAANQNALVTVNPLEILAKNGETREINCIVNSDTISLPNIEWFKIDGNGSKTIIVSGKGSFQIQPQRFLQNKCLPYNTTNSLIQIQDIDKMSVGTYTCALANGPKESQDECLLYCDHCNYTKRGVHAPESFANGWLWISSGVLTLIFVVCGAVYLAKRFYKNKNRFTAAEIYFFRNGKPPDVIIRSSNEVVDGHAETLPYDSVTYEVADDCYLIEKHKVLGSGAFGIVYKGLVKELDAAVKCTKPGTDKLYTKSLLSEIKILMHLGSHPNIVSLLGAKTKRLEEGIVYLFLEYCPFGNLEIYLRGCRSSFEAIDIENYTPPKERNQNEKINTCHLFQWARQIAKALLHLRSKHVLHGDLATRNVLVFDKHLVKITDFGLSRKQYNYAEYVKKGQEPLPWRWMAIESIRDLTFSHQSDVWSFGILLWEMFSLGSTPYPGIIYSASFIRQLEDGFRPSKPEYANTDIFKLMQSCWKEKPIERPKIIEIDKYFSEGMRCKFLWPQI